MQLTDFEIDIQYLLKRIPATKDQKRDLAQDCYVALLEEMNKVLGAISPHRYASRLCWSVICDHWRDKDGRAKERRPRMESLSDPWNYNKAIKVSNGRRDSTLEDLDEGMTTLPYDIYEVMYGTYVEGKTEAEVSFELGRTIRQIKAMKEKGIARLKDFFDVK